MDPTATYRNMLACLREGDNASAREAAESLRTWLARGGFYPVGFNPRNVVGDIQYALKTLDPVDVDWAELDPC